MSDQTLYVQVKYPEESILTYIFVFVLLIGMAIGIFAIGLIKNTYPYYAKETLNGTITCEEFKKFYKEIRKLKERKAKKHDDLVVKSTVKIHEFLEYLQNRDQDEDIKLEGPDGRIEEYYHTYNVPENHEEMTVDEVLDVMCTPVSEEDETSV